MRRVLFLLLALAIWGCQQAQVATPLRVGSNQWIGYEPVYLARSLGWLDEHRVRLVELPSSTQVMQALMHGNLEAGMLTLDEVLTLRARGVPLKVIALMDFSDGADVLVGRPGMRLEDLRGKRIGVENTAVGAILLDAALRAAGLTTNDVRIVPVEVDDHVEAFHSGRVDAVVTFEPSRSRLLDEGGVVLFDSSRIPGRIIDVLAVRADALPEHAAQIEHLLQAYYRALDYLRDHREAACQRIAPRLHLSPDAVCESYGGIRLPSRALSRTWLSDGTLEQRAAELARLMYRRGLLPKPVSTSDLAEPRFLR